jgi:hypothetical protein
MSIAAISSAHTAPISPEKAEGARPDHDGDGDDASVQAPVQAAPSAGTGTIVNTKA